MLPARGGGGGGGGPMSLDLEDGFKKGPSFTLLRLTPPLPRSRTSDFWPSCSLRASCEAVVMPRSSGPLSGGQE